MRTWARLATVFFMFLFSLLMILWINAGSEGAEIPSALSEVRETIENLKKIVSDPKLKGEKNKDARRARIRSEILSRMDLGEMAKRSLGRHWKNLSDLERQEYLKVFPEYIQYVYRKMIFESVEFGESANIRFVKERVDGEFAEADIVIDSSPEDINITFKLRLADGHWKAYDLIIEGMSQVSNLRSQFDRIISKSSFAELLKQLRNKT